MPLGLGLATSHAASMFIDAEDWDRVYATLVQDTPQPPQAADETLDVITGYLDRSRAAFNALEEELVNYRPDALIMVGDDQNEVFSRSLIPQMAVFLGSEATGSKNLNLMGQPLSENHMKFVCNEEIAHALADGLIERGFDIAHMQTIEPASRPEGGLGHAFTSPGSALRLEEHDIPVVIFFLNAYHVPLLSGRRCYDLGIAIAEVMNQRSERIAIYGSGGLSHDPRGTRAGWVDEELDRWFLKKIEADDGEALTTLFSFDTDALHGGTGELRSWIVVAAAMHGTGATVLDYIPAYRAVTGLSFAYWLREGA